MAYEIRELGIGGILDAAVKIVKDNFGLLFGIVGVGYLPVMLVLQLIALSMAPVIPPNATPEEIRAVMGSTGQVWLVLGPLYFLVAVIVYPLTNAAMTHAIANRYLNKSVTIGGSFRRAAQVLVPLLLTSVLYWFVVMLGFVLLIVPGFLFLYWFSFFTQVVVIEGVSGTRALSRSKQVIKGNFGTFFLLGFLIMLIQAAIGGAARFVPQAQVQSIVSSVLLAILFTFITAAYVVFYFSCRCKSEHFDLTMLAESVTQTDI